MPATEFHLHRKNFTLIDEKTIDALINSALLDGSYCVDAWGQQSHLIALSVALHIRIRVQCFMESSSMGNNIRRY